MQTKDRFEAKIKKVESGCFEWQSTLHRDGYGKFWYDKKQIQAHRMSWILYRGEIPEGKWILHKCDNRKCVNPDHLYVGTVKENVRDMVNRGRAIGNRKYSDEIVSEIREMYATGKFSQQQLADKFGVNQTQVSRYVRGTQRKTT